MSEPITIDQDIRDALSDDYRKRALDSRIQGDMAISRFLKDTLRSHAAECDKIAKWIREGK